MPWSHQTTGLGLACQRDTLHGANRKALTAILLAQGLRPTRAGSHIAVYDAALADAALADLPGCRKIVDIAKRVIGQMPPF